MARIYLYPETEYEGPGVDVLPRVRIEITGTPNEQVYISRYDQQGRSTLVRQAEPIVLNATGTETVYDYEAPWGVPIVYRSNDGARRPTRLDHRLRPGEGWIIAPTDPSASVKISFIETLNDSTWESGTTLTKVMNKERMSGSTNVTLYAEASGMTFRTDTIREAAEFVDLRRRNPVFLLQIPAFSGVEGIFDYVFPSGITRAYTDRGNTEQRAFSFTWQIADRPAGGVQAAWTVARLHNEVATVADVRYLFATVADLRRNIRRSLGI